ncbi:MAG: hypothetical protein H6825_13110 [Planctomycetes bacterium]|nr:hypothetical protein [Planctomycetota bacterium]
MRQLRDELAGLREEVTDLRTELRQRDDAARAASDEVELSSSDGPASEDGTFFIPRRAAEFAEGGEPAQFGDTYTKPYLTRMGEGTYLGGYIDLEFVDSKGSGGDFFDQHRFVPFLYADVSDRVKLSAEIELEHGHEVEVEYAQLDYLFGTAFNLRAGILLLPLGKLNEVHDSPIQDLTFRPLVDTYIIPTTLRDAGLSAFGRLGESVGYQVAVTNGFRGLDAAGESVISKEDGLREAAPHEEELGEPFENTNDSFAYSGRVAYSPILGAEVGASALIDHYDELDHNRLAIYALDATLDGKALSVLPDPLELQGEAAWADLERDAFAKASGVPNDMNGYYVQANWHFGGAWLEECEGDLVEDGAHFTFVTRYDSVELDDYSMRRTTFGLNFRPDPTRTVFKLDYQFNDDSGALQGTRDDDALVFSLASYF